MLTGDDVMEIKVLGRQGFSIHEIARRTGRARNTVRSHLRSDVVEPVYGPRQQQPSKLDPNKAYLRERIKAAHPTYLPGTVLLRELMERGYEGSITILRDFLRSIKHVVPAEPLVRFETEPGEQMQVNWCQVRKGKNSLSAFVATLGFSRSTFVTFTTNEQLDTLIACHEAAFAFFGGVPRHVLYDNMKTVVLERDSYGIGKHRFNPRFRMFAGHYGFIPRLCRPYRAKTKGKVERFNRYLQESFYHPLRTRLVQDGITIDAMTANVEVRKWLRDTANVRLHGTTGKIPQQVLEQEERSTLLTLPSPWRELQPAVPAPQQSLNLMQGNFQPPLKVYDEMLELAS